MDTVIKTENLKFSYKDEETGRETPILKGNQAESLCYQIMNYIDTHIFALHSLPDLCGAFPYNYSYLF